MKRAPVSVVVIAAQADDAIRPCIESIRASAGVRDEIVLVRPAGPQTAPHGVRAVECEQDSGPDEKWRLGLAASSRDIVVFVDADTLAPPHALDRLSAMLEDPSVRVCAPICDLSFGRAQVATPYDALASRRAARDFARDWRRDHLGESWTQPVVGSAVFAVRKTDAPAVLDAARAGRLAVPVEAHVAGDLFWHHAATVGCALQPGERPLLSATYIVKDEEQFIAESLASVQQLVDEIVVYDTGSTDRTREIAREAGAVVIDGYWNDHFADARNRSLQHCTGTWLLVIDPDETLSGEPAPARAALRSAATDLLALEVRNLVDTGLGTPLIFTTNRLARRDTVWWDAALHEQVLPRGGASGFFQLVPHLSLLHKGYLDEVIERKDKARRNVALTAPVSGAGATRGAEPGELAMNRIRSLLSAGDYEVGATEADEALAGAMHPQAAGFMLQELVRHALNRRDVPEARRWWTKLAAIAEGSAAVSAYRAVIELQAGEDLEMAADLFDLVPDHGVDALGLSFMRAQFLAQHLDCLGRLGRWDRFVDEALRAIGTGYVDVALPELAPAFLRANRSVSEIAATCPQSTWRTLVAQTRFLRPADADAFLERLFQRDPQRMEAIAGAAAVAHTLPVERVHTWNTRLAGRGPSLLERVARDEARCSADRFLAAALALEGDVDEDSVRLADELGHDVADNEVDDVLASLRALAPGVAAMISPA